MKKYQYWAIGGLFLLFLGVGKTSLIADETPITVNLQTITFSSKLPVNKPFIIKGKIGLERVEKIKMDYSKNAVPEGEDEVSGSFATSTSEFSLTVKSLAAAGIYQFKFIRYQKFQVEGSIEDVYENIFNPRKIVNINTNFCGGSLLFDQLKTKINTGRMVRDIGLVKLNDQPVPRFSITENCTTIMGKIQIRNALNKIQAKITALGNLTIMNPFRQRSIYTNLKEVDEYSQLTPNALKVWESSLSNVITVRLLTKFFLDGQANGLQFDDILQGKAKFTANKIEDSDKIDVTSLKALIEFFELISKDTFKYKQNCKGPEVCSSANRGVFDNAKKTIFKTLAVRLKAKLDLEVERMEAYKNLEKELYLENVKAYHQNSFKKIEVTISEKIPGSNNYTGTNVGLGYSQRLKKPFLYVGANFYFVPIDKDKDIGFFFNGTEKSFLKERVSLLFGFTRVGLETKEHVLAGSGLVFGTGLRLHTDVKFDLGILVLNQEVSPISNEKRLRYDPFISLSFDFDLFKQFTDGFAAVKNF